VKIAVTPRDKVIATANVNYDDLNLQTNNNNSNGEKKKIQKIKSK